MKIGDYVELKPNNVFKEGYYKVTAFNERQIIIDISINKRQTSTALLSRDSVLKEHSKEKIEEQQKESEVLQPIFDAQLFKDFHD